MKRIRKAEGEDQDGKNEEERNNEKERMNEREKAK